jgi:hypothetical protein
MTPVLMRNRTSTPRFGAGATAGAVVLALCLALTACSSGSKKKTTAEPSTTQPPKVLTVTTATLKIGKVDVQSAGPPNVQIDKATGKAVLTAAQKYIDTAVFGPLGKGQLGSGYGALFDRGLQKVAAGPDIPALTDLDVGKVATFTAKATPVNLSALVGTLGEMMYIGTAFDLTVKATATAGRLTITHHVELTFAQTGKSWLVTAYRVQSVRQTTKGTTTTTAKAGSTP